MYYSNNPGDVRVEFFKPGGKWYMTETIDMSPFYNDPDLWEAVRLAIRRSCASDKDKDRGDRLMKQFTVVVQDPYHRNGYPIMLVPEQYLDAILEVRNADLSGPRN